MEGNKMSSTIKIICTLMDYQEKNNPQKRVRVERHPILSDRVLIYIDDQVAEVIVADLNKAISACSG